MKRIFATVLCATLLLSPVMMTAHAVEDTDTIGYIEEMDTAETGVSDESNFEDYSAVLEPEDVEDEYTQVNTATDSGSFDTRTGVLANTGDRETNTFVIDHSITPDIVISARASGNNPAKLIVLISDDAGGKYTGKQVSGIPNSPTDGINTPKGFWNISNQTGATVTYKVTVEAKSDNAEYIISCGPVDKLSATLGGRDNAVPVAKNISSNSFVGYIRSYSALLNGNGDWFRYTAEEGDTYIALRSDSCSSLAFKIYDSETGLQIDATNATDIYTKRYSTGYCIYTAQRGYELEAGHEYFINMYSTKPYAPSDLTETYDVAIGLPCIDVVNLKYVSPRSYSLSARKPTTFRVNVDGFSDLSRPVDLTLAFSTSSLVTNGSISSVIVTSPNGKSFPLGALGEGYFNSLPMDFGNFLNSPDHVQLNGTWTITATSNSAISGLKFKISGGAFHISCNDPQ